MKKIIRMIIIAKIDIIKSCSVKFIIDTISSNNTFIKKYELEKLYQS